MKNVVKLGDVCKIVTGSTPKSNVQEFWNGNLKWLTPAELDENSFIVYDTERKITFDGAKATGLKPFPAGTVILSSRAPIGKVAVSGCEMYCNQGFKNLICGSRIHNIYLYWFLKSKTEFLNSLGRGATFKEISKPIVENIDIPLPSYSQQESIAEQFNKIQKLIALCMEQHALLETLVKSRFIEMFGDPALNPYSYPVKNISDIADYWNGLTYKPDDVSVNGTIVLRSSNIQNGKLDFKDTVRVTCKIGDKKYVQNNDILMCSRNGSAKLVGKVALIDSLTEPMCFGAFMMIIRSNYYPYLLTYFNTEAFRRQLSVGATTTINQITGNMLSQIKLPVPPLEQVKEYLSFMAQVDKSKLAVQKSLNDLETLKNSLMQQYFG